MISKLKYEVASALKYYVYVYTDPRNGEPFYIGKGKGNRVLSHLADTYETEKVALINEIRDEGLEPQIDILRHGLTENEAKLVEAAAIDLIGKANLTNVMAGNHGRSFGRITLRDVVTQFTAKKVSVKHKAILITINKRYRSDMTPEELYEATRGIWKLSRRREKAEYAMSVYRGIVREVYRIKKWYPSGTLTYHTLDASKYRNRGRWEFGGEIAEESIRQRYVGNSVGMGGQNPIRYVNILRKKNVSR